VLTDRELTGRELTGRPAGPLTDRELTGRELADRELTGRELAGRPAGLNSYPALLFRARRRSSVLTNEASISRSLSFEMKSCTLFSSSIRTIGLRAS